MQAVCISMYKKTWPQSQEETVTYFWKSPRQTSTNVAQFPKLSSWSRWMVWTLFPTVTGRSLPCYPRLLCSDLQINCYTVEACRREQLNSQAWSIFSALEWRTSVSDQSFRARALQWCLGLLSKEQTKFTMQHKLGGWRGKLWYSCTGLPE